MIRTAIIGITGFGGAHVGSLRRMEEEGLARTVAVAQPPFPGTESAIAAVRERGIPVYEDWQEMLAREQPEVVTIPTPVHLHYPMASAALAAGAHVFLEKPPVPTLAKLDALVDQAQAAGRLIAVDFQMLAAGTTRDLKALLVSGALGAVKRVTAVSLLKRLDSYYERAAWHGQMQRDGEWAMSGPIANAVGHVLNQCLYFTRAASGFAQPVRVEAELYQAHPNVENEDTAAVRVQTDTGAVAAFYPTFCHPVQIPAWIDLETEKARVRWDYEKALIIRWADGREERREYGPEERVEHAKMFRNFFRAVRGEEEPLCPLAATRAFTAAVLGAYEAGTPVRRVHPDWIERVPDDNSTATLIRDVRAAIEHAAAEQALFTEAGTPWA